MAKPLLSTLLALGLAFGAGAQSPGPPAAETAPGRVDRKDTVRLFIVHKMRENLALSDAQTLKVLDVLEAIDAERESVELARRTQVDKIQALLADPATPEASYREAVAQFRRGQEQSEAKMRELEERLLATMTPKQQAQFLLLRRQLLEDVRQDVQRGRTQRGNPRQRQAGQ